MWNSRIRPGIGVIGWLVSVWLTVTQTVSETLANIILAAMALVSLWIFWPWLKRIRPWPPFLLENPQVEREVQTSVSPPANEALRQRCCKLSAELFEFYKRQREDIEVRLQSNYMTSLFNDPVGDQRRSEVVAYYNRGIMDLYSKQFGDKVLTLSDDLAQHNCITSEIRDRFESPTEPQDIRYIAQRLAAICERSKFSSQEHRRQRTEQWRAVIRDFNFKTERFGATDTYAQMKPYLKSEVIEMLEAPRTVHVGNEARGELARQYTLLDEVARIEEEWDLI